MSPIARLPFEAIEEYVGRYRRSDVPPLEISEALDLFPTEDHIADFRPGHTWENEWPHASRAGVYLIYSAGIEILYVGSSQTLGSRLYSYFGGGNECVIKHSFWIKKPRFVINIAVPLEMPFEAAALEGYLIRKLQPAYNIIWREPA